MRVVRKSVMLGIGPVEGKAGEEREALSKIPSEYRVFGFNPEKVFIQCVDNEKRKIDIDEAVDGIFLFDGAVGQRICHRDIGVKISFKKDATFVCSVVGDVELFEESVVD